MLVLPVRVYAMGHEENSTSAAAAASGGQLQVDAQANPCTLQQGTTVLYEDREDDTIELVLPPERMAVLLRASAPAVPKMPEATDPAPALAPALASAPALARAATVTPAATPSPAASYGRNPTRWRGSPLHGNVLALTTAVLGIVIGLGLGFGFAIHRAPAARTVVVKVPVTIEAPVRKPEAVAAASATLAADLHATPVRVRNPFDVSEVFEFPAGTRASDARQSVAELLLQRARERRAALTTEHRLSAATANDSPRDAHP